MKTLVIGASVKPERYSYKATNMLNDYGHDVFPLGLREGKIGDIEILTGRPAIKDIDTVTLYLSEKNQHDYYEYIIDTIKPRRIIFNPGTENYQFQKMAQDKNIEVEVACTLVLLSSGQY